MLRMTVASQQLANSLLLVARQQIRECANARE